MYNFDLKGSTIGRMVQPFDTRNAIQVHLEMVRQQGHFGASFVEKL